MKKLILAALALLPFAAHTQEISSRKWRDLFSYSTIIKIVPDGDRLVAATTNGIFFYEQTSGIITKLSKANGLHSIGITAFDYNPETKTGLIGYRDGSMEVISPSGFKYIVDIPIATGYTGNKKVNHISITGNQATVSADYGVSVFNLTKKEFGQTAFFREGAVFYPVNEAAIIGDRIYAATNQGLKTHLLDTAFPVYSTWATALPGVFTQIAAQGNTLVFGSQTQVFQGTSGFTPVGSSFTNIRDITLNGSAVVVTDEDTVSAYGGSTVAATYDANEDLNTGIQVGNALFAGTAISGIKDASNRKILPDGPYSNRSYKIEVRNGQLLVSTGARQNRYNSANPDPRKLGFYYYTGSEWVYPSLFLDPRRPVTNILDVVQNPAVPGEFYAANYTNAAGQAVYRLKYDAGSKDFTLDKTFDFTQNNIYFDRPTGLVFDENNQLFLSSSFLSQDGIFAGIYVHDKASDSFLPKSFRISGATQKPTALNGKLWVPLPRTNHFAVYDYKNTPTNFGDDRLTVLNEASGLPASNEGTLSFAMDNDGTAWIGGDHGVRILPDAEQAIDSGNPQLENIVIRQNGLNEELFRNSSILQIEVDGGNHKWVSVNGGGVYYLSEDGTQTIKHFTAQNSPLPTNEITDIKVDRTTGTVYFVSFEGIVAYQGDVAEVTSNFGHVVVYPNPVVTANFKGVVTIRGLAERTNIRITDAAGNVVHTAVATGGYYEWDLNNTRGARVASGIYFLLMTNGDGTDKATAKIAVVN